MSTATVQTGICRFDVVDRHINGYMVRIMRHRKMYQEFFSDVRCGGQDEALKGAEQRYAELLEELPDRIKQKGLKTVRNKTGKVGVHVGHNVERRWPGCEYWNYTAAWLGKDNKRINVTFAWNKFGEDVAWELACIARDNELQDREKIMEIYEQTKKHKVARKPR